LYVGNPRIWEAEASGLQIPGQPGLHSKTLSKKQDKITADLVMNLIGFYL
jgi:hypothetical protein